jgi:osmoprotectant transport system substrate-binding protein
MRFANATLGLRLGALCLVLSGACTGQRSTLRVGAKDFAEQAILSEMLARLLRQQGGVDTATVECGDTYSCYRALQTERVDLMVDYSGTGLAFLGKARVTAGRGYATLERVRKLYAPLGLTWLGPLGFDNGYRILVRSERAAALGLATISDLEKLEHGLRVACPPEYLNRPQDSLAALVQRYGLRLTGGPVVIQDPGRRLQALFDGRADVVVGYATDGAIFNLGLKELEDDLGFFPPYDAAVVVRTELLGQRPELETMLRTLEGRLSKESMRQLNYQVQVEGREASVVARRFLRRLKLLSGPPVDRPRGTGVALVVHQRDHLDAVVTRAIQAVRTLFPGRSVTVKASRDPVAQVAEGRARLAVLGAERFFRRAGRGPPLRESRLEALAVLTTRMIHVVRRRDESVAAPAPLTGRIGVAEVGSGRAQVAESLVTFFAGEVATHDAPERLLSDLSRGKLDGVVLLAEPGSPTLARAFARGGLELHPLVADEEEGGEPGSTGGWLSPEKSVQIPYLRLARIPAETYVGQSEPIETLGAQVVLAGPAPGGTAVGAGGPAAALPVSRPFTRKEIEALTKATGVAEAPDPVLPSAWSFLAADRERIEEQEAEGAELDTLLNILAIAFLVWLVFMVVRRDTPRAAGS